MQRFAGSLVAVDGAAMQRALVSGDAAESTMELELQDRCQEISRIGHVAGYVILGAGVEIRFTARDRRRNPLILRTQLPPSLVVICRLHFAAEDLPTPLVHEITEG